MLRDSTAAPGKRLARSNTAAAATNAPDDKAAVTRVLRRTTASNATRSGTTGATRTAASRSQRVASKIPKAEEIDHAESVRESKRIKLEEAENIAPSHARDAVTEQPEEHAPATDVADPDAKDAGWEDLDAAEADDPLMVAEYVNEIFGYMKIIEVRITSRRRACSATVPNHLQAC